MQKAVEVNFQGMGGFLHFILFKSVSLKLLMILALHPYFQEEEAALYLFFSLCILTPCGLIQLPV